MGFAPIAIFCYNRPKHLSKLLQSLTECPEWNRSEVYFFRDGPRMRTSEELESIEAVDRIIDQFSYSHKTSISRSKSNLGLAESIKNGVSMVLKEHDKVIVLEDDLLISRGFLKYMNDALNLYNNQPEVMHVSGYMFPIKALTEQTFFFNYTSCWGWGTWKRAWKHLEWDCLSLKRKLIQEGKWNHFSLDGHNSNETQLDQNIFGQKKTWAVRWNASVELRNGYCLHPAKSLVNNLGFDGSGENCPPSNREYYHSKLATHIRVEKKALHENQQVIKAMKSFYKTQNKKIALENRIKKSKTVNRILDISPRKLLSKVKKRNEIKLKTIKDIPRYTPFSTQLGKFKLEALDSASFLAMWRDIFEKEIYLFSPMNDNPVIIDAGANIGLASIYWSNHFPLSEIYAYEADPMVYDILEQNLSNNNCSNVTAINKAIWYEKGDLKFDSEGADAGKVSEQNSDSVEITAVSISEEIKRLNKQIDLLKMDIEGAEVSIFENETDFLKSVENLFLEYHSFESQDQKLGMILQKLEAAGMRYRLYNEYDIMPDKPFMSEKKYGEMDLQVNIFAERIS